MNFGQHVPAITGDLTERDGTIPALNTEAGFEDGKVRGSMSNTVSVVEVGPRDGLQNESSQIPTPDKIAFVDALSHAGLLAIEVTSFVNPNLVPQLADAAKVMTRIERLRGVRYSALVPNERGLLRALEANADAIALFTSATDAFAAANVGGSIDETFDRFAPVVALAHERRLWIRGYVSVAFGCPYSGPVTIGQVVAVAERLSALGCDEICLADTIGVATSETVQHTLSATQRSVPAELLALHFHDTTGKALQHVETALNLGVRVFDSSAGGLGGCPFAPGAPGNLATEHLVCWLESQGMRTGIDGQAVSIATASLRSKIPGLTRYNA